MDGKTSAIDPLVRKGLHIDQDMTNEARALARTGPRARKGLVGRV
jgi:hypothetical protein